jgi:hypothetical protein
VERITAPRDMRYIKPRSAALTAANALKDPHTHGFVVEFESAEDRDYYVFKDPAHQEFVKFAGEVANGVKVVDYEPGKM